MAKHFQTTNTHRINTFYAISKAQDAVKSWEAGVAKARAEGTAEDIAFCEQSLKLCKERLEWVKNDVEVNWTAYL
jgi:hypothetical protein